MATTAAAAATKAPKTIQLLDPTTLATSRAVRYPPSNGKPIQGKVRFPNSKAAKHYREQESIRLRKALQHVTHGKNIFAYNNLRTNQVIYSLSRTLERQNVLSQLIYHGKKTVPATLRKDMWIPYFSLHFPSSSLGLSAYKMLREFAVQRQLAPEEESITNTEETLSRKRPRDPLEAKKWDEIWKPRIGQIMMKKDRARVLMDQKATSVADVATVLAMQEQKIKELEEEGKVYEKMSDKEKKKSLSHKARKRLFHARVREKAVEEKVRERIATLERALSKKGIQAKIDEGDELVDHKVADGEVKILWTDLQDAQFAENWPESVRHGELEPVREHIMGSKLKAGDVEAVAEIQSTAAESGATAESQPTEQGKTEEPAKKGLSRLKFWS
ncbi:hypothetical protein D8B26_007760 [Coccidioides posadasii str. Silveira]|uniref:Large ribosomal subunit protein mL67 n=2 Tax=Coccidioides posadasii TaxID=199306 RepID=E9D2X9_COCPS|nr:hypothetical protein CPC735_017530 [Coccidioides posadasii C735 delta SOWgp]EER25151.1 hypothetical protein CPC735_017530 [Coccidioides posadasii C735 delta SOWgp]EFW19543.1 conserved hypothetical protein [Coccidioides posadasii str. Silveira]QVM13144.1 hypothetical protein D8B26_007760 [Coccidioides posadasii str. Silveira]|eukprot:XP_003067296.1 hypothetical protein CPC735_017530 [Coccidioides posadasii C735 delta SOWgp]